MSPARTPSGADALREYAVDNGLDIGVVELDVGSQDSADRAVETVLGEQGRIDVVVHNAAHLGLAVTEAFTAEQLRDIFDTNALGPHRVNRAVLPHMRVAEAGLLLYVGSTTSRMVYPFQGPYEASKAAMDSLAQVTGYEVARYGIDVVIVMPGAIMKGTEHFSEGTRPADSATAAAYSRLDGVEEHITARLTELSPPEADPRAVGEEIARVVALPTGKRPFRPMVDFLHDDAERVNDAAEKAQGELMERLGISDLLQPATGPGRS